jgi:hypothetical protein
VEELPFELQFIIYSQDQTSQVTRPAIRRQA